jgi:hypothetical protein
MGDKYYLPLHPQLAPLELRVFLLNSVSRFRSSELLGSEKALGLDQFRCRENDVADHVAVLQEGIRLGGLKDGKPLHDDWSDGSTLQHAEERGPVFQERPPDESGGPRTVGLGGPPIGEQV